MPVWGSSPSDWAGRNLRARTSSGGRALLDRYCVACHSDRLRTGGLSLERLDVGDVQGNAEVFEKVHRKLSDGLMPPAGRPRPAAAAVEGFLAALETALDAAAAPDPGRIPTRRLNRTEYVKAVHDLLELEIDGAELLPGDLAGFGFDNNADALAITPALMNRYMAAAMHISRTALSSPENGPAGHVYAVPARARQDARMGAVRHARGAGRAAHVPTEDHLDRTMVLAGRNFAGAGASLAVRDFATAKARFSRTREQLAVSITFWRHKEKSDAIGLLRDTIAKLDALDAALSAEAVDAGVADALARDADAACQACHAVYRALDPETGTYELKRGSVRGEVAR